MLVCGPDRELGTRETSRAVERFQKNAPYSPAKEQPKGPALCSTSSKPRLEATRVLLLGGRARPTPHRDLRTAGIDTIWLPGLALKHQGAFLFLPCAGLFSKRIRVLKQDQLLGGTSRQRAKTFCGKEARRDQVSPAIDCSS